VVRFLTDEADKCANRARVYTMNGEFKLAIYYRKEYNKFLKAVRAIKDSFPTEFHKDTENNPLESTNPDNNKTS